MADHLEEALGRTIEYPEPLLFLDIDGVLNDHAFCEVSQSCTIKPQCMAYLNQIIYETQCKIVLTSAWRYMIHGGDMTIKGFEYMLRTHGLITENSCTRGNIAGDVFIGMNRKDAFVNELRSVQVNDWIREAETCGGLGMKVRKFAWCIIDDMDLGFSQDLQCSTRFVRTNGTSGLNHVSARQVIEVIDNQMAAAVFG